MISLTMPTQPGLSPAALQRFLARAQRAARLPGEVHVRITSSAQIRAWNRKFRNQDKATDVIAFPANKDMNGSLAGDIAISAPIAARQARRFGHTAEEEVKILVLHGLLHLAGYDHEPGGAAARTMARKEQRLRQQLALPAGLLQRSTRKRIAPGKAQSRRPGS
jgi:probable rRNA maturation factor